MSLERVLVAWAPSNRAACKCCGEKFNIGDNKVGLCTLSEYHAGHDVAFHHLRCCLNSVARFCSRRKKPPDFYCKLTLNEAFMLSRHCEGLLLVKDSAEVRALEEVYLRLRKALIGIGPGHCKKMLAANGIAAEDAKLPKLAHKCAVGLLYGKVTTACPACQGSSLVVAPIFGEVFCDGNVEGFGRCSYKRSIDNNLQREQWVVTSGVSKSLNVSTFLHPDPSQRPILVFQSQVAGSAEERGHKRKRSTVCRLRHDQLGADSSEISGAYLASEEPAIDLTGRELLGMRFFLAGRFIGGRPEVLRLITSSSGAVTSDVADATHILVCSGKGQASPVVASAITRNPHVPVVGVSFIRDFRLAWRASSALESSGMLLYGSKPGEDIEVPSPISANAKCFEPACSNDVAVVPSSISSITSQRRVSEQQMRVDPECGFLGEIVKKDDSTVYNVTLNQVANGISKYYIMQLLQMSKKRWVVFKKWGSTGNSSIDVDTKSFDSLTRAVDFFEKTFKDKTGTPFRDVHAFVKKPGKYNYVDLYTYQDEPCASRQQQNVSAGEVLNSQDMPSSLQHIVRSIFDAKELQRTMDDIGLNSEKMPLGQVSVEQIKLAYLTLADLSRAISSRCSRAMDEQVFSIQVRALSDKFFSQIPCQGDKLHDIKDGRTLHQKIRMLDELMHVARSQDLLVAERVRGADVASQYLSLGISLEPLVRESHVFKMLANYVYLTHSAHHSAYSLRVRNAFKVTNKQQDAMFSEFSGHIGNKQLLWHGSRLSNWCGILSQGLRVAPPEAPVTGYMFGKGVYFANSVSKSANYCHPNLSDRSPRGLLLLCEVALGRTKQLVHPRSNLEAAPTGFDSVHGVGRFTPDPASWKILANVQVPCGRLIEIDAGVDQATKPVLQHDEFIIYEHRQHAPRFLLEIDFLVARDAD